MKIQVQCSCGKTFSVDGGFAGRRGKCPHCGGAVTVPAPAKEEPAEAQVEAVPEEEAVEAQVEAVTEEPGAGIEAAEERPRRHGRARPDRAPTIDPRSAGGWQTVERGLGIFHVSMVVFLAIVFGFPFVGFLVAFMLPAMRLVLGILILLCLIGSLVGMIAGRVICCAVPGKTGLQKYIIGSILTMAGGFGLAMLLVVASTQSKIPEAASIVPNLMYFSGEILFLLFLRGIGSYFKSRTYESSVRNLIIFDVVLTVAMPALLLAALAGKSGGMLLGGVLLFVVLLIVMIVWYLRTIGAGRDLIRRNLGMSGRRAKKARTMAGRMR